MRTGSAVLGLVVGGLVAAGAACSGSAPRYGFAPSPTEPDAGTGEDVTLAPPTEAGACADLRCRVPSCATGETTAIEGEVFDPAGKTPLYNVLVYVPNAEVEPLELGVSCQRCAKPSGDPIVAGITDEHGHFRLEGVPAGTEVPLVVQVGKWRRRLELPSVAPCATTTIPRGQAHLPRNSAEGDMPRIAIVTGGFDELGCLLTRVGVDGSEYGTPDKDVRVHVYRGKDGGDYVGRGAPAADQLWSDAATLSKYDMVMLACEGWEYDEHDGTRGNKTIAAKQAMVDFANRGGKIFATHYHYTWFKESPSDAFRDVATWNPPASAHGKKVLSVDTTFPKGEAFARWLVNVGASTTPGSLEVENPATNVAAVNPATTQRWLYGTDPESVAYMSFNTPIGAPADQQCGRAVFSDIHVGGERGSVPLPAHCGSLRVTPQETALEFLMFDLAGCVQPDADKPSVPR